MEFEYDSGKGSHIEYQTVLVKSYARWASHCFPIEKVGRLYFMHMIARTSINKDINNRKNNEGHTVFNLWKNDNQPNAVGKQGRIVHRSGIDI